MQKELFAFGGYERFHCENFFKIRINKNIFKSNLKKHILYCGSVVNKFHQLIRGAYLAVHYSKPLVEHMVHKMLEKVFFRFLNAISSIINDHILHYL